MPLPIGGCGVIVGVWAKVPSEQNWVNKHTDTANENANLQMRMGKDLLNCEANLERGDFSASVAWNATLFLFLSGRRDRRSYSFSQCSLESIDFHLSLSGIKNTAFGVE